MRVFNFVAFSAGGAQVATTRDIETPFIWTQSEAEVKCPAAAAEARGRWTGQWRIGVPGQTTLCQITDLPATANGLRDIEAGPIWNQADAETKCPRVAADAQGRWTGQWKTTVVGQMSVCQIAEAPGAAARDVEAGPIWNQADAELKCPVVAAAVRGKWNGQWVTTRQGQMSVCGITDMPSSRTRNVDAGPIWNQADAEVKCPVAATAVRGKWTGQWRTTVQGQMSVCEIADGG